MAKFHPAPSQFLNGIAINILNESGVSRLLYIEVEFSPLLYNEEKCSQFIYRGVDGIFPVLYGDQNEKTVLNWVYHRCQNVYWGNCKCQIMCWAIKNSKNRYAGLEWAKNVIGWPGDVSLRPPSLL